jgi:hypothetical protein
MGKCKYCGKPAGILRRQHWECWKEYMQRTRIREDGKERIVTEVSRSIRGSGDFGDLEKAISEMVKSSSVSIPERNVLLVRAWEESVNQFLEDGIIDEKEEERLVQFKDVFGLSKSDLDKNGAFTKIVKAAILRDVFNGRIPFRMKITGDFPINFQRGEVIIWAFPNSSYLEDKKKVQYVGRSHGVSIRVMKGFYYRFGAFKGRPVENIERVHLDTGWVVITNRNIYFSGSQKSLRVPYAKIVSFEPFSDGIGIMRDAQTAKAQIFVTGDGWFTYNLVTNLAKLY